MNPIMQIIANVTGMIKKRMPNRTESKRSEVRILEKELETAMANNNSYDADIISKRLLQLRQEVGDIN